jgi:excisionase family DNA binding protein
MGNEHLPQLLTTDEVLRLLRIGRTTLWKLRRQGKLKAIYIGRALRFDARDVAQFLNAQKESAST